MTNRREHDLNEEIYTIVFRIMQLKVNELLFFIGNEYQVIQSIQSNGHELAIDPSIKKLKISALTPARIESICLEAGYQKAPKGSRNDIEINGKKIQIRCLNYTNRPLINHSNRSKYIKACNFINFSITALDKMVDEYWRKRELGIISEDIENRSEYSPFTNHKEELKPLLTYIAFNGTESIGTKSADFILDYSDATDEKTWHLYNKDTYIDTIWPYLRFSFRADRGMPANYSPSALEHLEIHPWVKYWRGQYKGALHIRVSAFNSNSKKASAFIIKYKDEIKELNKNKGEIDEIIIKIFLLESRMKKIALPIDQNICNISSVGQTPDIEYDNLPFFADWRNLSIAEIVGITKACNITKAGRYDKADVYVNKIGISLKSHRGASPSLINQTKRSNILRVMENIHHPIVPLDNMINKYWELRLSGLIGEDVQNTDKNSPFSTINKKNNYDYLLPLLNYFIFDGTGTKPSNCPAQLVLVFTDPINQETWRFYNRENYVATIWEKLIFAIRSKGTPSEPLEEDKLWIRHVNQKDKGSLNVRVKE